jgi:hypothetical protein
MEEQSPSTTTNRRMPDTITARNAVPVVFDDFNVVLQVVKPSNSGRQAKFTVSDGSMPQSAQSDWTPVGGMIEILGHDYELRSIKPASSSRDSDSGYTALLVLKTDDAA